MMGAVNFTNITEQYDPAARVTTYTLLTTESPSNASAAADESSKAQIRIPGVALVDGELGEVSHSVVPQFSAEGDLITEVTVLLRFPHFERALVFESAAFNFTTNGPHDPDNSSDDDDRLKLIMLCATIAAITVVIIGLAVGGTVWWRIKRRRMIEERHIQKIIDEGLI